MCLGERKTDDHSPRIEDPATLSELTPLLPDQIGEAPGGRAANNGIEQTTTFGIVTASENNILGGWFVRALFLAFILPLALVACTTVGPITADDSMVVIDPSATTISNIDRTRRWNGQNLVEEWEWPSGELYVVRLPRTMHFTRNFRLPEDLIEESENWPTLVRGGTEFDVRTVQTSNNRIGQFIYAVSEADARGDRCFLMLQGLPASAGANFAPMPTATKSQGYISFYDCQSTDSISAEGLENLMLKFSQALRHVQR